MGERAKGSEFSPTVGDLSSRGACQGGLPVK
jgi:hypothetical protein